MPIRITLATVALTLGGLGAAADPIEIVDQGGNSVVLTGPAERVVTIPMPAASMFIAVDGSVDRMAGMHGQSYAAIEQGVLGQLFPDALAIRSDIVAGQAFVPNIEALLAADPDLVFQWADRGPDLIKPMTDVGLTVVGLRYGTQDLAEGWIGMMGAAAGEPEKAAQLIDWQRQARDEVAATVAAIPQEARPRVLYFLRYLSDMQVAGAGTYQDFAMTLAGGVNAAAELSNFTTVNVEQILAWDPEVILLNNFEAELDPADVYANPVFADLSAVKNHRVYRYPLGGYRWDPPSQEAPLAWHWLAMVFHGDAVDYPIRQEIRDAFGWIYGQAPTDAQLDAILHLELNRGAAGYERFAG